MTRFALALMLLLSCAVATASQAASGSKPEPLTEVDPPYPQAEFAAGHEGVTTVQVTVSKSGALKAARLKTSSGFPALDAVALEALKQWTFKPATNAAGKAVEGSLEIPIVFRRPPPEPNQADMQKAIDAVMKRPCSDIDKEVADFKSSNPNGDLRQMKLFKLTSGIVFVASGSSPPAVREAVARKLPVIYVQTLMDCSSKPDLAYGDALNDALAANREP